MQCVCQYNQKRTQESEFVVKHIVVSGHGFNADGEQYFRVGVNCVGHDEAMKYAERIKEMLGDEWEPAV